MSSPLARLLLRHPPFRAAARRWLDRLRPVIAEALVDPAAVTAASLAIPEITPLVPRRADGPSRLTLLLPGLSERHVFGGIATALQVFDRLRGAFAQVRIVVLDEREVEPRRDAWYGDWPVYTLGQVADLDPGDAHIVAAGDRYGRTLPVRDGDRFVATIWWSAHLAHALLDWQGDAYGPANRRLAYLIQDFEPGFYPWSARSALADATYRRPERTLAMVNSGFLARYLQAQGIAFADAWTFEPRLNPGLRAHLHAGVQVTKERTVVVYGRPGTERNAFPLLVAGLQQWVAQSEDSAKWRVLSVGEPHAQVELGRGLVLESLGKLPLDAYARLLASSAVGVSLMVSPHPSYPPLEMAAFGCRVVTNGYATKDLSALSDRILSADRIDPAGLAAAIARACGLAEGDGLSAAVPARLGRFLDTDDPFAFAGELAAALQRNGASC
jgi:hypothetical protein